MPAHVRERTAPIGRPAEHRPLFRRLCLFGLALGAPLAVAGMLSGVTEGMTAFSARMATGMTLMFAANLLLALGYLSGLVLLAGRPDWSGRLLPLAAAGRMALTNYLIQIAGLDLLFSGYALGLGRLRPLLGLAVAFACFAAEVVFSTFWLRSFRFGPAEWLCRSATYGRLQPMRRSNVPADTAPVSV